VLDAAIKPDINIYDSLINPDSLSPAYAVRKVAKAIKLPPRLIVTIYQLLYLSTGGFAYNAFPNTAALMATGGCHNTRPLGAGGF